MAQSPVRLLVGGTLANKGSIAKVGQYLVASRVFSSDLVRNYAELSLDHNPIHLDADYTREASNFERPIVHGMLYSSMFSAMFATTLPGSIYRSQSLNFHAPVYIGKELFDLARAQASEWTSKNPDFLLVYEGKVIRNDTVGVQLSSTGSSNTIYLTPWSKNKNVSESDSKNMPDNQEKPCQVNEDDYSALFESDSNVRTSNNIKLKSGCRRNEEKKSENGRGLGDEDPLLDGATDGSNEEMSSANENGNNGSRSRSRSGSGSGNGTPTCRICRGTESEASGPERLFRPCECRGSMAFVHVGCLNEWRRYSENPGNYLRCHTCGYTYNTRYTDAAKILEKLTSDEASTLIAAFCTLFIVMLCSSLLEYFNLASMILGTVKFRWTNFKEIQMKLYRYNIFVADYWFSGLFLVGSVGFLFHFGQISYRMWQHREHLDVDWFIQNREVGMLLMTVASYTNDQLVRTISSIGIVYILYEIVINLKRLVKKYIQEFGETILEVQS